MLTALRLAEPPSVERHAFPFAIPALRGLREVAIPGPVTFFAGENGSGKSTLLEAIAIAVDLPTIGSGDAVADDSLTSQRKLARSLRAVWDRRTRRGFFLRAEDFFGFVGRLDAVVAEMEERLAEIEREYRGRSELAKRLAAGPAAATLGSIRGRYGENLDANSHGETFLHVFRERFVPGGLYLIDEPEAALSPQSQLGLVSMMSDVVNEGGQLIVATHLAGPHGGARRDDLQLRRIAAATGGVRRARGGSAHEVLPAHAGTVHAPPVEFELGGSVDPRRDSNVSFAATPCRSTGREGDSGSDIHPELPGRPRSRPASSCAAGSCPAPVGQGRSVAR